MPLSINTNLSSLAAQRALSQSQDLRASAVQRLSSGLRINAARDDAAGLAISERMTTQIRGLAQSARNAQDAIGMSQTAESALASISDNLQRVRELAVQAANGTNSATERQSLDAEVQQRVAEIDRIAATTSFGGIRLLDGSAGTLGLQIGMDAGQTVGVDLTSSLRSNAFGAMATVQSADLRAKVSAPGGLVLGSGDLTVQVGSGGAVSVTGTFTSVEALASAVGDSLRAVLKLGGQVDLVTPGTLAHDGKVIDDQRSYGERPARHRAAGCCSRSRERRNARPSDTQVLPQRPSSNCTARRFFVRR